MFVFILRPLKKRFSEDKKYYIILDEIFGIFPNNIELYKLALIHRSASFYMEDGTPVNNERLEFLGDAVLESIISDYLFIEFPDRNEGFLTQMRSRIVSRVTLNEIGLALGLDKHIIVQASNNHIQKHLYGDAFEAMVGAIYLDKGYDFVNRLVINTILAKHLDINRMMQSETDFKSRLIEWCQKYKQNLHFATEAKKDGIGFSCSVRLDGEDVGLGEGTSKKEAEQNASHQALLTIKRHKQE